MKKVFICVAIVALCVSSGAWAQQAPNSGVVATATATGLDGKPIQAIEFAFTDTWRQNRYYSVTQTLQSDQLRFPGKPWNAKTNPYEVKAVTVATSNMSGNGLGASVVTGVATGLASNPGPWFGLIPKFNNTNNNNGGNNSQSQGQGQRQRQGQLQGQGNVNAPVNTNINTVTPVNTNINTLNQGQSTGPFSPVSVF